MFYAIMVDGWYYAGKFDANDNPVFCLKQSRAAKFSKRYAAVEFAEFRLGDRAAHFFGGYKIIKSDLNPEKSLGSNGWLDIKTVEAPDLWILRGFDMFDGWYDITKPISRAKAEEELNRRTKDGTKNTCFNDGDYYKIFPADTKMIYTPEFLGR